MFIDLLNKLSESGRENPIKEPPYVEPVEPSIIPTEIPVINLPEKENFPIPETPPLKRQ